MSEIHTDMLGHWVEYDGHKRGIVRGAYLVGGDPWLIVSYQENRYGSGESGRLDKVLLSGVKMSRPW